ncbi:hypothetical protein T4B_8356, partial [Trichinella pseudospiralis]
LAFGVNKNHHVFHTKLSLSISTARDCFLGHSNINNEITPLFQQLLHFFVISFPLSISYKSYGYSSKCQNTQLLHYET